MHAAFAQSAKGPVFFWNLDGVVGLNGANNSEDVLFVQWCIYKMADWRGMQAAVKPGLKKVGINGNCTGRADDPLVETIKLVQASYTFNMDGRVTPIVNSAKFSVHGIEYVYLIMIMNIALKQMYPQQYPRLDLLPDFVWRIKDKLTYPFVA